jgi:hypothetical protein
MKRHAEREALYALFIVETPFQGAARLTVGGSVVVSGKVEDGEFLAVAGALDVP